MIARTDRRLAGIIAASAALHLGLLALLALRPAQPPLRDYDEDTVAVTLAPIYLVEPRSRARNRQAPAPIRARQARRAAEDMAVAPLYVTAAPRGADPGATGMSVGAEAHPTTQPPGTRAEIGRALKFGGVGCDQPDAVGMSPAERNRCLERLGAGAKTATYLGQGLSRDKQRVLDRAAAEKEAYIKYRDAPMPPGLSGSGAAGGITGLGDTAHGKDNTHHF